MSETIKEFYVDDVVYKFDRHKHIMFGVVIDSYEASDSDEYLQLQKGQILVLWSNHMRKQVCKQTKVRLFSRCIIPGDIVRRLEDGRETQRGYCKVSKQSATVQIVGTDKIIENVKGTRLSPVKFLDVGDAVCMGNKFGRVQAVHQLIRMRSECGSVVEVRNNVNYNVRDYWMQSTSGGYYEPCYPSQTVVCIPMDLKDPKWIKKSKTIKRRMELSHVFTIETADYVLVQVWWFNYANKGHTEFSELLPDDIRKLQVLPYANNVETSDRNFLTLNSTDVLIKKNKWLNKKSLIYQLEKKVPKVNPPKIAKLETCEDDNDWFTEEETDNNIISTNEISNNTKIRKQKKKDGKIYKFGPGSVLPVDIICSDTKVTVVWQDGTEEKDIPSTDLYFSVSLDDHEFFPGEWVVHDNDKKSDKYGVVQKVDNLQRTAEVNWYKCTDSESFSLENPLGLNEISVYDLKKHHKFAFRPGSIVKAKPTENNKMGRVIDSCPDGNVIVKWVDGKKCNFCPHQLELLPESEEYEFSEYDESYEDDDDDFSFLSGSWETESIESCDDDCTDDTEQFNLQIMATKVDFIRERINSLNNALKEYNINKDFHLLKDLLCVYDNSRYLDKYLGTSFFTLDSKHFRVILQETKKLAKSLGIELKGRLFATNETSSHSTAKIKNAAEESIQKMIKLESRINSQIEITKNNNTPIQSPICELQQPQMPLQENLCTELLIMLKIRMDLVYAELISRIDEREAICVLSNTKVLPTSPQEPTIVATTTPPKMSSQMAIEEDTTEVFRIIDEAPKCHHYYQMKFEPMDLSKFLIALKKEYKLLKDSLPSGVWVKTFSNRIDLLSLMVRGPGKTPYEDGLFLFDLQLSEDYPKTPPLVHYISYTSENLNPNLYVEGKVCVSLLGTWKGRGSEVWGPNSTLLQLIVSIQGLILVAEPYYNEAGYEKQTHTQQGYENSRTYNELVILKLVQSMTELLKAIPDLFKIEIIEHFLGNSEKMCERLRKYCNGDLKPDFPLLPVSKGLKLSLNNALCLFEETLKKKNLKLENC